ncbi:hypothetical protein F9C07_3905 [Aspergillus flavus]|uniref:Uncharacterized protein n=1 Tax=Aspergillus flavus (strain ATCC 200026 / FGSC A1120 / IAM 13836 / NRRL 3357 / JCM 12722 / SRRC 167) TaxID=332952 RepID=A0A7U2MUG1_ASPFN|nr:hypothetical protein F9C07_3905 [Aspergillus flavus]
MMIGAYVSYEVIASSATFNSAVKEENGKIYFMIYSGFHDQCGCGLAGRKLRMQPEEATVKLLVKAVCIEGITLKNKELKLRFSGNRPQKKHAADGNTKIRKIKI